MKKRKKRIVYKRPAAVFLVFCMAVAGLAARLAYLQTGPGAAAAAGADGKYIKVDVSRGYIYDRDLEPLVNTGRQNVAAVIVTDRTAQLLPAGEAFRKSGVCLTLKTDAPVTETPQSVNVSAVVRYGGDVLCTHILGYTDRDGKGVCGIEKSFDKVLADARGQIGVQYTANGLGTAIAGEGIKLVDEGYNNAAGVVLTVDKEAQRIAEDALKASDIKKGAAVVLEVETGAVIATASVPAYDVNDLASSLENGDLPFLNRALAAYPVGSVFKPFIAAAALEHGAPCPKAYQCKGAVDVSGVIFRCYRSNAHGETDLGAAVSKSCNCYFISLGQTLGAAPVLETAAAFGFGKEIRLTGDLHSAAGMLPDVAALASPAALANLCFGQGTLLASPLQLAAAYAAIANGGVYRTPYITKALVDETKTEYAYYKNEGEYRAASKETCRTVGEALGRNMLEGTGKNGASELVSAAGKTATAQTGDFRTDGTERLCTWFCGFFPYESPRYAVAVLNEDGSSAAADCAPVFKAITEGFFRAGL